MAHYLYEDVCYQIPEHIIKDFIFKYGREPDGDPNYDGDCWTLTAMYIEELEDKIQALEDQLKNKQ